jgi:hypothetical protein
LTPREFDLLYWFARHPGEVFSRLSLLDHVWGYQHEGYEHTVNTHINRLRVKIEKDAAEPDIILTVWGKGYKFAVERSPTHDAPLSLGQRLTLLFSATLVLCMRWHVACSCTAVSSTAMPWCSVCQRPGAADCAA